MRVAAGMGFDRGMIHRFLCLLWSATALFASTLAAAPNWNQWRGPQRDGRALDFKAPATWKTDSLAKKWSVAVGEGHAAPAIVGDRVYVFARDNDRETMRALALADGRTLWQESYAAPYEMNSAATGHGKGPKSSPVVADGRVFALGIAGHFSAYDAEKGTVLWRKDFVRDFKTTTPDFGASASPIVDGNNVIIHVGGDGSGALTAFDVATGVVRWKWDGDGPGYASPVIATIGGVRQVITQSQKHCVAVAAADGKLLWKISFTTPYEQNAITPVVAGDLVIFAGVQKPVFAVRVSAGGANHVWETNEVVLYMSTPVLRGSTLYGLSTRQSGSLFALNAASGAVLWKGGARLGENASLTDIGSALLVLSTTGELLVYGPDGAGLKELAKYKVAETPVWAALAVAADNVLVKDLGHLTLFKVASGG